MKNWKPVVVVALIVGVVTAGLAIPLLAEEKSGDDDGMKKIAALLKQVKVSLADAATKAEEKTGGKAIEAELESDDDELEYEVVVVVVKGDKIEVREVDIDAKT
ncbi:MAG: PepSY domain-containing protein, partial [Planctomycetota bacterium]